MNPTGSSSYFDALIGKEIKGKYRIDRKLGSGGMGAVFEATQIPDGKRVAIKVIAPRLAESSKFVKRFRREARVGAVLSHPHIIKVYDFGEAEAGLLFMVMEFVKGETLKAYLARMGALSPERCLQIFKPLCEALKIAHKRNILHRDLKPDNILLAKDEAGNEVLKLADFGLVKLTQPDAEISAGGANLTEMGEMFGTPYYMSPEQVLGQTVKTTSDIYSLGVLVYQMLTGRLPLVEHQLQKLLMLKVSHVPEPLSKKIPSLTDKFDEAVLRAMAISPEDRYQTVEEFLEAFVRSMDSTGRTVDDSSGSYPPEAAVDDDTTTAMMTTTTQGSQRDPYMATTVIPPSERNFIQRLIESTRNFFKKLFG